MPLTLAEEFESVKASTQFEQLSALDRVWTGYLTQAQPPIPENDVQALDSLIKTMSHLLEEARERAYSLREIVNNHTEELSNEYQRIIEQGNLSERESTLLRETVERHGGIVEFANRGTIGIMENSRSEIDALEAKMQKIREGGFTAGDLSTQFLCNLTAGIITGSILAPVPMNFIGLGAGLFLLYDLESRGEKC
jgi:hypothetical protein